jgi:hypothetical protein
MWKLLLILTIFAFEAKASPGQPYNLDQILPFDPAGWYRNGEQLEKLYQIFQPKIVVEVGCWLGASTRHLATLLPPNGVVYAVDHWLGSVEHQPGQPFWSPILPDLYEQFLSNVIHAQLTHKIIPIRMSSRSASEYLNGLRPDLVYIDASHDFDSVYADLTLWYPFVKGHGILCGDDADYSDITRALKRFAEENGLEVVKPASAFWYLQE